MSETLDTKKLPAIDGFDISARIVPDTDSSPLDVDCYSAEDIAAWREDQWSYVGTIVTASRHGIELGSASLWGSEYGSSPGWGNRSISPLDGEGEEFINGYGPGLIAEAVAEAKATVEKLTAGPMWLIYADANGERHYQPWQDVATAGTLIDGDGDDMELVGWTTVAPGGAE